MPTLPPTSPEASISPEAKVVPGVLGTSASLPTKRIFPFAVSSTLETVSSSPPVSSLGKSKGVKACAPIASSVSAEAGKPKLNKLPSWVMVTICLSGTEAMVISPPGASRVPVLITKPPTSAICFPVGTSSTPSLIMAPAWSVAKAMLFGFPTKLA